MHVDFSAPLLRRHSGGALRGALKDESDPEQDARFPRRAGPAASPTRCPYDDEGRSASAVERRPVWLRDARARIWSRAASVGPTPISTEQLGAWRRDLHDAEVVARVVDTEPESGLHCLEHRRAVDIVTDGADPVRSCMPCRSWVLHRRRGRRRARGNDAGGWRCPWSQPIVSSVSAEVGFDVARGRRTWLGSRRPRGRALDPAIMSGTHRRGSGSARCGARSPRAGCGEVVGTGPVATNGANSHGNQPWISASRDTVPTAMPTAIQSSKPARSRSHGRTIRRVLPIVGRTNSPSRLNAPAIAPATKTKTSARCGTPCERSSRAPELQITSV